jgi:trimeric autotransporter adhesin
MANPILKIKRGSGTPVSLATGELAMDLTNKSLLIGTAEGVLAIGGEHVFAKKSYVDGAVSTEEAARIAADSTLTSNLNAEISRAQSAESDLSDDIVAEETARIAAVSAEASARSAADTTLDNKITTEKGRIDAILSASEADKDSFSEIVALINSVDTENDTAFAGYVASNNAALAQEVSDRIAGDATLQSNIDSANSDLTDLTIRVTTAESDIVDNASAISAEETARIAAVSAEASARSSADTTLQNNINSEATARSTADSSLQTNIDSEATARANADSALDTRVTALETVIDGGAY